MLVVDAGNLSRRFTVEPSAMTNNHKYMMSAFALSAAALFLGGCGKPKPEVTNTPDNVDSPDPAPAPAADPVASGDDQVKCFGINSCKGESVCAVNKPEQGIEHACAGENDCKNKGWIKATRSECGAQSGEVLGTL